MRHLAAYLLATLGDEKNAPSGDKIKSILGSVGVEADEEQLKLVLEKFKGKNVNKVIDEGCAFLACMPSGGGGGAAVASAAPVAEAAAPAKEEKKEESEEESDEDMGFGLFD